METVHSDDNMKQRERWEGKHLTQITDQVYSVLIYTLNRLTVRWSNSRSTCSVNNLLSDSLYQTPTQNTGRQDKKAFLFDTCGKTDCSVLETGLLNSWVYREMKSQWCSNTYERAANTGNTPGSCLPVHDSDKKLWSINYMMWGDGPLKQSKYKIERNAGC